METLKIIKELVEQMSIDTKKVVEKGNKSASIRARKNAQKVKHLIQSYRKDILDEIRKYDTHDSQ
jgi:hypothetical protein